MCFEENCIPHCSRWPYFNEPYCRDKRLGTTANPLSAKPVTERTQPAVRPAQVPLGFTFQDVVESFKRLLSGK